jgi:hypothetical protein
VFALPVRLGLDRGPFRPALVLGPVGMASGDNGGIGLVAGVELGFGSEGIPVIFDVRYYKRATDSSSGYPLNFSLGAGTRFQAGTGKALRRRWPEGLRAYGVNFQGTVTEAWKQWTWAMVPLPSSWMTPAL